MTPESLPPIGVILAGGRGRRFGGTDKSFLNLDGRPLLGHVIARVAPQVGTLLINTNSADATYRAFGLRICGDAPRSTPATGPLVGLTSVMDALEQGGDEHAALLSVPVDTPFLPPDLATRLASALAASDALIAFAATTERDHPIVALWGPRSRHSLRELFDQQPTISLHGVMAALGAVRVVFPHSPSDPFFNVNSPQDIETAERIAATMRRV